MSEIRNFISCKIVSRSSCSLFFNKQYLKADLSANNLVEDFHLKLS